MEMKKEVKDDSPKTDPFLAYDFKGRSSNWDYKPLKDDDEKSEGRNLVSGMVQDSFKLFAEGSCDPLVLIDGMFFHSIGVSVHGNDETVMNLLVPVCRYDDRKDDDHISIQVVDCSIDSANAGKMLENLISILAQYERKQYKPGESIPLLDGDEYAMFPDVLLAQYSKKLEEKGND